MDFLELFKITKNLEYVRHAAYGKYTVKGLANDGSGFLLLTLEGVRRDLEKTQISPSTIENIDYWIAELGKYKDSKRLSDNESSALIKDSEVWIDRIRNILIDTPIIEINKKSSLNYHELMVGAKAFFNKAETWDKISDLGKADLDDAARCLLVDLPTPSAMIVLRAAEGCLRQYYKSKMNKKPPNWKTITDELKANGVNEALLQNLDYIRKDKRNVAEHPDKRFSPIEAERLFLLVINTIEEMIDDL